jgi:curli production assembly/transport component CsgF
MRIGHAIVAAGLTIASCQAASAEDLVYTPINPSFGGNPFNSSHLLGIANGQNKFKDPSTATSGSEADIFARQLQSRLLSALSSQITDAIFGQNAQEHGTVTFGDQTIEWTRGLEEVTLTITDTVTGQVTTIQVPTIIDVAGGSVR